MIDLIETILPEVSGKQTEETVKEIYENDRYCSFDRFDETIKNCKRRMEDYGLDEIEILEIETSDRKGLGLWTIPEVWTVKNATLKIVDENRVLADYLEEPLSLAFLSAPTPPGGVRGKVVVIDSYEDLERLDPKELQDKIVLTRMSVFDIMQRITPHKVLGIISDVGKKDLPDARAWMKFGYGGWPYWCFRNRCFGFSLSRRMGDELREYIKQHPDVLLEAEVNAEFSGGTVKGLTGTVKGRDLKAGEILIAAHLFEPGAIDNASGCAVTLEALGCLKRLIMNGKLRPPKRTIRMLLTFESFGTLAVLERLKDRGVKILAALNPDCVGADREKTGAITKVKLNHSSSPSFIDCIAEILHDEFKSGIEGFDWKIGFHSPGGEGIIADPNIGVPTIEIWNIPYRSYHSSWDTPDELDEKELKLTVAFSAALLYVLADLDQNNILDYLEKAVSKEKNRLFEALESNRGERYLNWLFDRVKEKLLSALRFVDEDERQKVKRVIDDRIRDLSVWLEKERSGREMVEADNPYSLHRRAARAWCLVPVRTRSGAYPHLEDLPIDKAAAIKETGVSMSILYWVDGERSILDIAECYLYDMWQRLPEYNGKQLAIIGAIVMCGGKAPLERILSLINIKIDEKDLIDELERMKQLNPEVGGLIRTVHDGDFVRYAVNRKIADSAWIDLRRILKFFELMEEIGFVKLQAKNVVRNEDIVAELRRMGLKRGDKVMVHSSLSSFGHVEGGADAVIDALIEVVGEEGLIMMPTFNHGKVEVYDKRTTPSFNGRITEVFRLRKGVLRSVHPTHPLAAFGKDAEKFLADHEKVCAFGIDSPLGRLIRAGGWVLFLGTDMEPNSARHVAEAAANVHCTGWMEGRGKIVDEDGRIREVPAMIWRAPGCKLTGRAVEKELRKEGLVIDGKVGPAKLSLTKGSDIFRVVTRMINEGWNGNPPCRKCPIQPKRD